MIDDCLSSGISSSLLTRVGEYYARSLADATVRMREEAMEV